MDNSVPKRFVNLICKSCIPVESLDRLKSFDNRLPFTGNLYESQCTMHQYSRYTKARQARVIELVHMIRA